MTQETNETRMLGVLPSQGADPIPVGKIPDGGTQVTEFSSVDNDVREIHEVTGGTTFYLTGFHLYILNTSGAIAGGTLEVRNNANELQYYLSLIACPDANSRTVALSFSIPLEIQAGWKVVITSSAVDADIFGGIFGYEA